MNRVLDATAMVAYLNDEPGAAVVEAVLLDPASVCYAHAINLCEVYYDALRHGDEASAKRVIAGAL